MTTTTSGSSEAMPYTLYHNPYSICSIQMRYLIRVKGEPEDSGSQMIIQDKLVDIFNEEQFSEEYLTRINPNGQVCNVLTTSLVSHH